MSNHSRMSRCVSRGSVSFKLKGKLPLSAARQAHLDPLKEAMHRMQSAANQAGSHISEGTLLPGLRVVQMVKEKRQAARADFEVRFLSVLEAHEKSKSGGRSVASALAGLPEHCFREASSVHLLRWLGIVLITTQLLSAYFVLTGVLVGGQKTD